MEYVWKTFVGFVPFTFMYFFTFNMIVCTFITYFVFVQFLVYSLLKD